MPVAVEIPIVPARAPAPAPADARGEARALALVCRACERVYRLAASALATAGACCSSCGTPRPAPDRPLSSGVPF